MKELLHQLIAGKPLTADQAAQAFETIMTGNADPAQTASLLTLLAAREPTTDELLGAAGIMRKHVLHIEAPDNVIDTCGTGGVGSRIFNVSTTAAIVAASCGVPVAKHGNRSVTSKSGSSDVLKALGVNIDTTPEQEARCLREANICFAFAPKHHPAMKHVAPVRQALGFSTIFNILGPITNPAGSRRQLVGTRSQALADKLLDVLVKLGAKRAMLVCGSDPASSCGTSALCELSVMGPTYVASYDGTLIKRMQVTPESVGLKTADGAALVIDSPEQSAALVRRVLSGEKGPARDIVLLNGAAALWVGGTVNDLATGITRAAEAVDTGRASATLERLVACSHAT